MSVNISSGKFVYQYSVKVVKEDGFKYDCIVRRPMDISGMARQITEGEEREFFIAFFLDMKNRVKGYSVIAIGDLSSCIVHPREVFRPAVLLGAASVILAHNHPTGNPIPSNEDKDITSRLINAGNTLGIAVLDHLIVGEHGLFTSLRNDYPHIFGE